MVDLLRVRQLGLSELDEDEEEDEDEDATDAISIQHDKVMSKIYLGGASRQTVSILHSIVDPAE